MHEYVQDAMTYERKHVDLIYEQASMDCHDIILGVFQQKQIRFLDVIENC